jgi:hypothetical protein
MCKNDRLSTIVDKRLLANLMFPQYTRQLAYGQVVFCCTTENMRRKVQLKGSIVTGRNDASVPDAEGFSLGQQRRKMAFL